MNTDDGQIKNCLGSSRTTQSHKLYSILLTRVNAYDLLVDALQTTNQSGALRILMGDTCEHDDFKSVTFDKKIVLGKGSCGTIVFKGKFGDRDVAVKRIPIAENELDCYQAIHEINVLKSCDKHENIVRYFGSKKSDRYFLIFLEICDMTLSTWVNERLHDTSPLEILRQTTVGLGWLHEHHIVHRDLKPDNILFTNNPIRVKISDFGLSRKISDGRSFVSTSSIGGTQGWVAPEILTAALDGNTRLCKFHIKAASLRPPVDKHKERKVHPHLSCPFSTSDIFSLGCVYYFVMTGGKHPFGDRFRCQGNILDNKSTVDENDIVHGCRQNVLFVKLMISENPEDRLSCPVLLTCPIFWSTDRHIRFILDVNTLNKDIQNNRLHNDFKSCPLHPSDRIGLLCSIGHHLRDISICSNSSTFLQNTGLHTTLQQYYISGTEFSDNKVSDCLGSSSLEPQNGSFVTTASNIHQLSVGASKSGATNKRFQGETKVSPDTELPSPLSLDERHTIFKSFHNKFTKHQLNHPLNISNQTDDPAIGIDLGTTYSCVAIFSKDQQLRIIRNSDGIDITPSFVAFREDGKHSVGRSAKDVLLKDPWCTIFDAKRMIGRRISDPNLQSDIMYHWPFEVQDFGGRPLINIRGKQILPEQISAILLANLKSYAENWLRKKVTKAVISVPAHFTDNQRVATKDAAEIAGLKVLNLLNEPTAAAISYQFFDSSKAQRKVLVFDLGGGTFDAMVLQIGPASIEVLSAGGDTHLGGEEFDKNMLDECVRLFRDKTGINLFDNKQSDSKQKWDNTRAVQRLKTQIEDAKYQLCSAQHVVISVDCIANGYDFIEVMTRTKFEELNMSVFKRTIEIVDKALNGAKVSVNEIDEILLVGGSTRIPKIQDMLRKHFNNKMLSYSVHPDLAVAYGAAIQAALLNGCVSDDLPKFERIQDVTNMTYNISTSIEGKIDETCVVVPKNTKIPHRTVKSFKTSKNKEFQRITVYQGDNNHLVGTFELTDLQPSSLENEWVDVTMEIDRMGILSVTAMYRNAKETKLLTVRSNNDQLSEEEKKQISESIEKKKLKAGDGSKSS